MSLKPHLRIALLLILGFGLLAVLVGLGALQGFDRALSASLQQLRHPWMDRALLALTLAGDGWVMTRVTLVAVALLAWQRQWRLAAGFGLAMLTIAIGVPWLKELFAVARPMAFYTGRQLYSFPSHHVAGSAAFWALCAGLVMQALPRGAQIATVIAAAILITVTALSRVYLAAHWPSDVIAGVLLGLAVANLFLMLDRPLPPEALRRRRSAVLIAAAWLLIASWHLTTSYALGQSFYHRDAAMTLQRP